MGEETNAPLHDEDLLRELARQMSVWPARWGRYRFGAQGIPAGHTYFGQLIAHDLTWEASDTIGETCGSARLDFASLFAADSSDGSEGLRLGPTSTGRAGDLCRSTCGTPRGGDKRNDQNLTLSQMVVLITKFHEVLAARFNDAAQAQRQLCQHLQWVTLHDFLPRVMCPAVYRDVMRSGAYPVLGRDTGLVPIEFAAAAFRLGHAMVGQRYPYWRQGGGGAGLKDLLQFTHHSEPSRLVAVDGARTLPEDWSAGWHFLLAPSDGMRVSLAGAIDENLAHDMFSLPGTIGDCVRSAPDAAGDSFSIAEHTLLRGNRLRLDSGQALLQLAAERLQGTGEAVLPRRLPASRLAQTRSPELSEFLLSDAAAPLRDHTPLWFYLLREADVHASGQHFGPLASRLTMETIHRAIRSDPYSILNTDFEPAFPDAEGNFGLWDLHAAVQANWIPQT
ncbi:hypothetical protein [Sulfitobacter aestuariivivens]|uniref:Uncharacterized protein n=1 Tax=Sulfitobacter aestuariivivens TaxID=2766981 RepID=A0A927D6G6_9RHOB|nr:hypothetical protein [Sulfitobacter aestuariivivens]MBD3666105.1 hypothetical protein [Sulfitobacter aestuariivivens]